NDRPVTATPGKGATTCMVRHVASAGEDSRVTVGSTPTVYHRRPEARGVAAVTPGRKAPAAAGAHAFLGPACGAARVIQRCAQLPHHVMALSPRDAGSW
ncbi:MAG TPA: hypothetical protein DIT42_06070, partial [Gammaproteobacteria bacterium]|nr:hypothetical protein [Gammaproteobacteria bacterium]